MSLSVLPGNWAAITDHLEVERIQTKDQLLTKKKRRILVGGGGGESDERYGNIRGFEAIMSLRSYYMIETIMNKEKIEIA